MSAHRASDAKVQIAKDGPYMVSGGLPLSKQTIGTNSAGESVKWIAGQTYPPLATYALCRCGHSAKKPFCDSSHKKIGFDGTETASREPYQSQAKVIQGPTQSLTDAEQLCAFARFCDPHGQVWSLVTETDGAVIGGLPGTNGIYFMDATGQLKVYASREVAEHFLGQGFFLTWNSAM